MATVEKECSKCKKVYPMTTEYFSRAKSHKCGFNAWCKKCYANYRKIYRAKHPEIIRERNKEWCKNNPDKVKLYNKRGHKKYRENHPEKVKAYIRKWYLENKDRVRECRKTEKRRKAIQLNVRRYRDKKKSLPATLTMEQWLNCILHFDNDCAYCGRELDKPTMDHFIPVAKNGGLTKDNILPVCADCNRSKSKTLFSEWYPQQEFYDNKKEFKILNYIGGV